MNNVSLVGRLTEDPELLTTNKGASYCRFTIAVRRQVKRSEGVQDTDYIDCIAWRKTAETLYQYFYEGYLIGISGKVVSSSYEKDGKTYKRQEILASEIFILEKKTQEVEKAPETPSEPETEETVNDNISLPFEIN